MTGERRPPSDEHRSRTGANVTRRGVLALGGATLLAGCGIPGDLLGSDPVTLDTGGVREIAAEGGPAVAAPLPVDVADEHVTSARERAESLLDSAPLPLSAEEMPNGAMREEVHDAAADAREDLDRAADAWGTVERLDLLAAAREPARTVAATWAASRDEVTAEDVRSARESVGEDIESFLDGRRFVGEDPARAVVVHDLVGRWARTAENFAEPDRRSDGTEVTAFVVGERAGRVERADASLGDARHVHERFTESLSDPRSLRSTFVDARESLAATIDSRLADLPPEDADLGDLVDGGGDLGDTVAGEALRRLHWDLPYENYLDRADDPAEAVVEQVEILATVGAFERLRDRIAAGDQRTVADLDDVRLLRSTAAKAVEDALDASADELLARAVLADPARWFDGVVREIDRYSPDGTVVSGRIADPLATYVRIETTAAATPDAVDEGLAALDAA